MNEQSTESLHNAYQNVWTPSGLDTPQQQQQQQQQQFDLEVIHNTNYLL
jgi:hypothetical protein